MLFQQKKSGYTKKTVLLSSIGSVFICILGLIFAQVPVYTSKSLSIGLKQNIKAVVLSDIHYGSTGSLLSVKRMVRQINEQNADVVFLVGDVFDNKVEFIDIPKFVNETNKIQAKYGVYAVTGNHEFISNNLEEIQSFYKNSNIRLLVDEEVVVADSFRVYGRMDYKSRRDDHTMKVSKSTLPLIVLDHQPQF